MPAYEYKHVRLFLGWAVFSQDRFHERLMTLLGPLGREGWELQGVLQERATGQAHLIFGRPIAGPAGRSSTGTETMDYVP